MYDKILKICHEQVVFVEHVMHIKCLGVLTREKCNWKVNMQIYRQMNYTFRILYYLRFLSTFSFRIDCVFIINFRLQCGLCC